MLYLFRLITGGAIASALCDALLAPSERGTGNVSNNLSALGSYKVSSITVSGISSGAYMAVQMHVSYSSIISGAAAFAGVRISLDFIACD